MRVAIDVSAIPDRPAGAGVYVLRMVEALATRGDVELQLVATTGDGERWHTLAPGAAVHDVVPRRRPIRLAWEQVRAPGLAGRLGCELWHGPHYTMPLRVGVPAVVTVHDLTFFDHPEWHERSKVAFFRRMIRSSTSRAAVLVCVSESTGRRLRDILDPHAPVVVVPHGVDHARFHPGHGAGQRPADLVRLHALGVEPPYVAFVGTIEPRKNVPGLVRAFARVAAEHPEVRLVIAGGRGWGRTEVDDAVTATGVGARVVRLGYVDDADVPALLRQAAAVAYPAFDEGFGLPALEALACAAPLVTTAGTPMAEVADDAALLTAPGDDAGLAAALDRLLAGGADVDRLRHRGPEVASRYTWDACAAGHVDAYRQALC